METSSNVHPAHALGARLTLRGQHVMKLSPNIIAAGPEVHHHGGAAGLEDMIQSGGVLR